MNKTFLLDVAELGLNVKNAMLLLQICCSMNILSNRETPCISTPSV